VKSCMSGRAIELKEGGDEIVIRFPYDTAIVAVVRRLSRRRFDSIAKCWTGPAAVIVEVVDALLPHGFSVAAAARELYFARGGTRRLEKAAADPGPLPPPKCA